HALDRGIGGLEHDVLEARQRRFVDQSEGGAAWLARRLRPAGQHVVDLRRGEIGFDREAAVDALTRRHTPGKFDRNRPGGYSAEVEAELAARRLVQRRLDTDVDITIAPLAIVERGRDAVELDVTPDPMAVVVGADLEQGRLDLLAHDHALG